MIKLTPYLNFFKQNKNEIFWLKIILFFIINMWLLIIFWRIILLEGINFKNNNIVLNKMNTIYQPILMALGFDVINPNTLKMITISIIVFFTNISILYFNQVVGLLIIGFITRYSYKSYTNYLINKDNFHYMGFEQKKEIIKEVIKEPEVQKIIIDQVPNAAASSWGWAPWIMGGLFLFGIAFTIWSHNTNANNMLNLSNNAQDLTSNLNAKIDNLNERITNNVEQITYNNDYTTKAFNNVDAKINLIDQKIINLDSTVQTVGENLTSVSELGNTNVLKLSQRALEISQQANEALNEIAGASNTAEVTALGLSKVVEILKEYIMRVDTLENKLEINQTPRNININPLNIPIKRNDE